METLGAVVNLWQERRIDDMWIDFAWVLVLNAFR